MTKAPACDEEIIFRLRAEVNFLNSYIYYVIIVIKNVGSTWK